MTAWDDDAQFFVLTPKSSLLDLWIFGLTGAITTLSELVLTVSSVILFHNILVSAHHLNNRVSVTTAGNSVPASMSHWGLPPWKKGDEAIAAQWPNAVLLVDTTMGVKCLSNFQIVRCLPVPVKQCPNLKNNVRPSETQCWCGKFMEMEFNSLDWIWSSANASLAESWVKHMQVILPQLGRQSAAPMAQASLGTNT